MRSSESIANLADALVKANLLIVDPKKDQHVNTGRYSYSYVALATITAEFRPVLQAHGLAMLQEVANEGVTTRLLHVSGEWIEFGPLLLPAPEDTQARGSATTYARRYQYLAALGIAADEDDEGEKAKPKKKASGAAGDGEAPTAPVVSEGVEDRATPQGDEVSAPSPHVLNRPRDCGPWKKTAPDGTKLNVGYVACQVCGHILPMTEARVAKAS